MTPLKPRDAVTCPKFEGHPTIPAECCVLRTVVLGTGQARKKARHPVCATCPLGRLRRQKLEAEGWTYSKDDFRARQHKRILAEVRARKRWVSTHGSDPGTSGK